MPDARKNAKNKVTGIAATFGGAKDIFTANVNKNAGPEAAALGKKEREQNQAQANFGNKDREQNGQQVKTRPSEIPRPVQTGTKPTTNKTRPSDGGDAVPINTQINTQSNNQQNQSSPQNMVNNFNYNPAGPRPANDNNRNNSNIANRQGGSQATTQAENRNQNLGGVAGAEPENVKNIPSGVPSTQRGGAPVIQNPTAVDAETASTLPRQISESLQNQAQVRNQNQNTSEDFTEQGIKKSNYDFIRENIRQQQEDLNVLNTLDQIEEEENNNQNFINEVKSEFARKKIVMTDDEVMSLVNSNFNVKFPWIMFSIAVAVETGDLILELLGIVLTVVIAPAGIAIGFIQTFIGGIMAVSIFFWNNYYAANASDYSAKVSFVRRQAWRFMIRRSWALVVKMVPYVGAFVPMDSIIIILTYRRLKKITKEAQEIYENKKNKFGV